MEKDGRFEQIRYFPHRRRKDKKKKSLLRRILFRLTLAAVLFITLAILILNAVTPTIIDTAEAKLKNMSLTAVNKAVYDVMTATVNYSDLITITKDQNGSVRLISANTQLINKLAQDTARAANGYIAEIDGISVSAGTLSGIAPFAGRGPDINFRAVPSGSVVCEFLSEFEEAGINQTRHKIFLEVICLVFLVLPARRVEIYNTVQVLVSENIIVGDVPETFLSVSTLGGTAYDLIPR